VKSDTPQDTPPLRAQVVVAAAIVRGPFLLAARRTEPSHLAGGWELPGGKVEDGESDRAALVREIREELGVEVELGAQVGADWVLGRYLLRVWLATLTSGEPAPLEAHDALAWVPLAEVGAFDWLPGDLAPALAASRAASVAAPGP
jgi:8-oxo-dGTP diphosphatase